MKVSKANLLTKGFSQIGLGTGRGFGKTSGNSQNDLVKFVQNALDMGMNWIDTAEEYFDGNSEVIIGKALGKSFPRVKILTKFSPTNSSPSLLRESVDSSLKRLKREQIDILQFHWPNTTIGWENTCETLSALILEGKIKAVGTSNFSIEELKTVKQILGSDVVSHQYEFNIFNKNDTKQINSYLENSSMIRIGYSPFLGLSFLDKRSKKYEVLTTLAGKYDTAFHAIVLKYLSCTGNIHFITGSTDLVHIKENLSALKIELDDHDIRLIDQAFSGKAIEVRGCDIKVVNSLSYSVYTTKKEALSNRLGLNPSPQDLAETYKYDAKIRPILVTEVGGKYQLVGGMVRYWASIIAHGDDAKVPVLVYG